MARGLFDNDQWTDRATEIHGSARERLESLVEIAISEGYSLRELELVLIMAVSDLMLDKLLDKTFPRK